MAYLIHDISDIPGATWEFLDRISDQQMTATAAWEIQEFCATVRRALHTHFDSIAAKQKAEGAANGVH